MLKSAVQVAKAACAAVVFALVYALVFTLIIQLFCLPASAIAPVNQVFKVLAIVFGGLLFIREDRGLIKGVVLGIACVVLTYLLFSAIAGSFSMSWTFALELLIGAAAGAVTGIIAVNIKKR
ncbi:MAG: TIGR04086 family membrane protein [Candidatus Coproplasma sp.]